ncbi:uncharacterized protein LOC114287922 [Camellia sinensis]|uniref:uncharacterized protein LOC114287922 n=1 Tax=Camellia sinensis TaxID=4442 RepID=UPI001035AFF0|nr:uncharacterized protein LOC114287922 [Camellia sinensis]
MKLDIDSKGRHFKCLFFAFEACIHGFKYCQPVLMLDETFLKGRHKGCLLAATEKDSNQGLYPLCFAIVDSERYDNWHWFLSKLFVILTPGRDITFVTDQHGGLLKVLAKVFSFSSHSFCPMHLKTNLKTYLSVKSCESKKYLLTPFSRCAYSPTIELFNELFEEFKGRCSRNVLKFLEDLPNECWCNPYFQGKRYGEMCTNAAESFNSWIRDKHHLFSTNIVDAIRVKLMEQFSKREKSYSCRLLEIDSFPCKHGFYAIKRSEKDLNCFLDDYYHVRSCCNSYSHSIYPVPSMWKPNVVLDDDVVLPPLCKKPVGCPRIERIPSKGGSRELGAVSVER